MTLALGLEPPVVIVFVNRGLATGNEAIFRNVQLGLCETATFVKKYEWKEVTLWASLVRTSFKAPSPIFSVGRFLLFCFEISLFESRRDRGLSSPGSRPQMPA